MVRVREAASLAAFLPAALLGQERGMVDVGGYRVDTVRYGAGEPVVVLLAGGGDSLETWTPILPPVGEITSVVAYSRAGHGRSELGGTLPRSSIVVAGELERLLEAMAIEDPVVLAGHSLGGLHARVFAALYPDKVAGLVLVDGTHERQYQLWGQLDPTLWTTRLPARLREAQTKNEAVLSEFMDMLEIQRAGALPVPSAVPNVPMAVLTGLRPDAGTGPAQSPEGKRIWRSLHDELFQSASDGLRIVTDRSGHFIHETEPHLVVEAIRWVVDRARSGGSP